MKVIVSPSGSEIVSVRTVIEADTFIQPGTLQYDAGNVDYEIQSKNDRILWETQEARKENGKQVFTSLAGETFDEEFLHYVDPENGISEPTPVDPNKQWRHYRVNKIQWRDPQGAKKRGAQEEYIFSMLMPLYRHPSLVWSRLRDTLRQVAHDPVMAFSHKEIPESEAHRPAPASAQPDDGIHF